MSEQANDDGRPGALVMPRTGSAGDRRAHAASRSTRRSGRTGTGFALDFTRPDSLSVADLDEIGELVSTYFVESKGWIGPAIENCDRVIRYRRNDGGQLAGISLLEVDDFTHDGRRIRVLYTRAVMLREYARGRNLIQRAGLRSFLRFGMAMRRSVYWFTECDTFRSYLLGMRNLENAWPRAAATMPEFERGLYNYLCKKKCGKFWNAARGVRTPISGRAMAPGLLAIPARLRGDPNVSYFIRMNPGYLKGDSLPIFAVLNARNMLCILKRAWSRLRRQTAKRSPAALAPDSVTEQGVGPACLDSRRAAQTPFRAPDARRLVPVPRVRPGGYRPNQFPSA